MILAKKKKKGNKRHPLGPSKTDISGVVSLTKPGTLESSCFLFGLRGVASYKLFTLLCFVFFYLVLLHPNVFSWLWGPGWACRGWCGFRGLQTKLSVQHYQNAALWISSTLLPVELQCHCCVAAQETQQGLRALNCDFQCFWLTETNAAANHNFIFCG